MIIKEVRIKNFRSYYGENNVFKFSNGLTLILGDNGDGKTTFFEALQWLFNTTLDKANIDNASEMRKSKLEIGENDEVSVFMSFEHDGEKSIEKSFTFSRTGEHTFTTGKLEFKGYETRGSERIQVSGKLLVDRCYDAFIQRFSMFKGESELNVFDSASALKQLVDKFSEINDFTELVKTAQSLASKSSAAYQKEMSSDASVSKKATSISNSMKAIAEQISQKKIEIDNKKQSLELYSTRLEQLEANRETSEQYKDIEDRRKTQEDIKKKLLGIISAINYNHSLLDRLWILCAFPNVLKEFQNKCSAFSKEKRKQEKDFDRKQAEELGKLKAVKEIQGTLINGATELPWYLPNQETMEEMIQDRICKVCGRPFSEHDEAYAFMVEKLNNYKKHVELKIQAELEQKKIEEQALFSSNHIEELHNLSISLSGNSEAYVSGIAREIIERQELVDNKMKELKQTEDKIQDLLDEKARLLIQAGNVTEAALSKDFDDIKGLFEQKGRAEIRFIELKNELNELQKNYQDLKRQFDELSPNSALVKVSKQVNLALEAIANAFDDAKKENLRRFLHDLERRANLYLEQLSVNDFHGEIHLLQTAEESTEIKLYSSNGTEIKKPSGSQKTVMYISILFAISDFTQEKRDEDYPLIFDAATSSFGDMKEDDFYNVINGIKKQCIIVTKDFLTRGDIRMEDINKLSCPIYRIKKADGFNQNNLATIRTTVSKIKE